MILSRQILVALASGVLAMVAAGAACGGTPAPVSRGGNGDFLRFAQDTNAPEITAKKITRDVVGRVVQVADVEGHRPPTEWTFEADEPRQIEILERRKSGTGFSIVIYMSTRNNPKPDEDAVQVAGKLQLHYVSRGGRWVLTTIENLTFKYSVGLAT